MFCSGDYINSVKEFTTMNTGVSKNRETVNTVERLQYLYINIVIF